MSLLKGWKLTLMAGVTLVGASGQVFAQKPGSLGGDLIGSGRNSAIPVSYGMDEGAMPAAVADPSMGYAAGYDPGMVDPSMMGGPQPCPECGGPCAGCGGSHCDGFGRSFPDLLSHLRGCVSSLPISIRPYGEGGIATQRWYDASFSVIGLARTTGADPFNTSSIGIASGNFVLGSNSVPIDTMNAGLLTQLNIACGPGSNVEILYFGLDDWDQTATVFRQQADLYSFISNFGVLPAGGFDDSDRSLRHSLSYNSELHNGELSFRRRWAEPYGFFQGSFLTGIRYLDLDERSVFSARGLNNNGAANNGARFLDYTVSTTNSLVGWQVGGDLWYNWVPGVKVGCELKTGIYNNRAQQRSNITANSVVVNEAVLGNTEAFVTQLSPQLVYRISQSVAFRTSYEVIWIDNVALAVNNFNSTPPSLFLPGSGRVASISNKSDIVYNGLTAGVELTW
ncbi:MAG: hypothetical protein ACK553_04315 [Planctomycetota bacterium]|jgi:hypothetical protein